MSDEAQGATDAGTERREYRVVWQREGCRRKAKQFARLHSAERHLRLLGPEPWTGFPDPPRNPDNFDCCDGHECGCGGLTYREKAAAFAAEAPPILFIRLESRPVGDWTPTTDEAPR